MPTLTFIDGERAGHLVVLTASLVAGRSPACGLEVPDPNVSREHCRFDVLDGTVHVADLRSSNGTFLDEVRIESPRLLVDGAVVRLGSIHLRYAAADSRDLAETNTRVGLCPVGDLLDDVDIIGAVGASRASSDPGDRLAALLAIAKATVSRTDPDAVVGAVLEALLSVFAQADRCFLLLGDSAASLRPLAARQRAAAAPDSVLISSSICGHALSLRESVLYVRGGSSAFSGGDSLIGLGIGTAMAMPLLVDDRLLGLLLIDSRSGQDRFTHADLTLANAAAQQVALALDHTRLLRSLERETAQRHNLCRYLPGALAHQVVAGEVDLELGGRLCDATVLFADLAGFTSMAESLPPAEVIALVNGWLGRVVPCIDAAGGSIDKFLGDAVLAVWGVPLLMPNAGDAAVASAIAMLRSLDGLAGPGGPLTMRIGIASGVVVAGNIGTSRRTEYTVLGDVVNVAQRLQAAAAPGEVLVCEHTRARCHGIDDGATRRMITAKNRTQVIAAYAIARST